MAPDGARGRGVRTDLALATAAWLAGAAVALLLPLLFFIVAERLCPPADIDPAACLPQVRTVLFWTCLLGASAVGAAACVLFPAAVVRRLEAVPVAQAGYLAGAAVLGVLHLTLRHPLLVHAGIVALAGGGACVVAIRRGSRR